MKEKRQKLSCLNMEAVVSGPEINDGNILAYYALIMNKTCKKTNIYNKSMGIETYGSLVSYIYLLMSSF